VEKKLFMQRRKKGLNVSRRRERRMKHKDSRLRSRSDMCSLADLAGSFTLPIRVQMGCGLTNEDNQQDRQAKS